MSWRLVAVSWILVARKLVQVATPDVVMDTAVDEVENDELNVVVTL